MGINIELLIVQEEKFVLAYPFLVKAYSVVCHQHPEKLITIAGHKTLVCARCFGIYLGALISSLFLIFIPLKFKLNARYLLLAAVPMFLDVIFYSFGLYYYSQLISAVTGLLLGGTGFFYFYGGLESYIVNRIDEN